MDISVNSSRPNFGMACRWGKKGESLLNSRTLKLTDKKYGSFMDTWIAIRNRQDQNPNNMEVYKGWFNRLKVKVHDSNRQLKPVVISERPFFKNDETLTKTLNRAEGVANRMKNSNEEFAKTPTIRRNNVINDAADEAEESGVRFVEEAEELADEVQGGSIIIGGGDPAIKEPSADSSPDINL